MERVKEGGGGGEGKITSHIILYYIITFYVIIIIDPLLSPSFCFWLLPHFPRRQNNENPIHGSFFASKHHGNAGFAAN